MVYPENLEQKIGFDKVKTIIKSYCLSDLGIAEVDVLRFGSDYESFVRGFKQITEFREILLLDDGFPVDNYHDLREVLLRLKIEGTAIGTDELLRLMTSLKTAQAVVRFFIPVRREKYPELFELTGMVYFHKDVIRRSEAIIDEKGRVKDTASENLLKIRKELRSLIGSSRNKVYSLLADAKKRGWTREDAEVTVRNGRVVIPVLANFKRSIKGFIHDESATGQTSYIEPLELFETNNRIRELEFEETNEIKRILLNYSDFIRPELDSVMPAYDFLGLVDFIRAKARFSIEEKTAVPVLNNSPLIAWKQARHLLLERSHRKSGKKVVPLDIDLDTRKRVLIVSGPNAGGKSVLLKTVALNQYMLQCGLPVPMREVSEAGIFDDIFIDIGDEQSIENDLSTYSSHLQNIRFFIENAGDKTLFLIDEFGTGTEPDLGGAIAAASLVKLYGLGAFGIVTTHYAQLKVLADNYPAMTNGAMMFDAAKLTPLFRFKPGKPGSSFAFEIAKSTGLQTDVLEMAAAAVGTEKLDFDLQLQRLENEKDEVEKKLRDFEQADKVLAEMIGKYEAKYKDIKAREKQIIYEARRQAKEILAGANKAIENAVSEIKMSGAAREKTKRIRKEMEEYKRSIDKAVAKAEESDKIADKQPVEKGESPPEVIKGKPSAGDYVVISGQTAVGVVEQIKRNTAVVNFDSVKVSVKVDRLLKVKPPKTKRKSQTRYSGIMKDINSRAATFSPLIDVRGKRAADALDMVSRRIDDALLTGNKELEILHGKGDGILRQVIRDFLQGVDQVQSFKDAALEFGGSGKTIVKLK
jgi:DNA mismatch repair protein MutS2